jgi:hypothetical protein
MHFKAYRPNTQALTKIRIVLLRTERIDELLDTGNVAVDAKDLQGYPVCERRESFVFC